jgi:hypothetical protein
MEYLGRMVSPFPVRYKLRDLESLKKRLKGFPAPIQAGIENQTEETLSVWPKQEPIWLASHKLIKRKKYSRNSY